MNDFLKSRWFLFLVLAVFIICKIPHLHYAYYWDESWPYAVAIRDMYRHGVSLMPTAVDSELSRGHPLFFHAIAAIWINIFGGSHISMHSFALLISVLFLIAIYEAGLRLFDKRVAIMSLLLVATQVMFFVQSSFVLFEMLIAFLAFLSLYFYVRERYFLTILCLTALFYTKESGLIMGFILGIDALLGLFNQNKELKQRVFRVVSIAIPCVLIGVFFLIQKHIRGWYILPFYNDLIEHKWDSFWLNFRINCLDSAICRDNRHYYFIMLLMLSFLAAIKNKSFKFLAFVLPAVCIYYFVDDMRAGRIMPGIPFFISFILSIIFMLYLLRKLKIYDNPLQEKFIVLSIAFIFCFLCFSSMNFFTPRYLLVVIVPLLFFAAVVFNKFIGYTYDVLFYPVLVLIALIGFYSFKTSNSYGDTDLGAFDGLDVQQHVVDWFEKNNYYDKSISCGSFLELEHLKDAATGFLHSDKTFKNIKWDIDPNKTDLVLFDSIESDSRHDDFKKNTAFHLVYRYQKGIVWAEVYGRN